MTSIILCLLVFLATVIASRRSLLAGLTVMLCVGYVYGITRANLAETFSHFIFDASVIGLYVTQLFKRSGRGQRIRLQKIRLWVAFLMIWPALLFLLPIQDTMVELVGLRGNIFLLPFLLIGARLTNDEVYNLSLRIAALNIIVFALAVVEFFLGVERFFPENPVTQIIYLGKDIAGYTAFRIPASFTSAHAYAGTMVLCIPFLVGAWLQKRSEAWQRYLLIGGLMASVVGIFLTAARIHAVVLFLLLIVISVSIAFSKQLKLVSGVGWLLMLLGIGWVVSGEQRLQRFMTLQDSDVISSRISISVNKGFFERAIEYPLGNGLGGGGTSLPYFLQDRVKNLVLLENEYARITLEQGIPGLCLWVAFIMWVLSRRPAQKDDPWHLGRRLAWVACAAYFVTGLLGTGLLTSIPQTCLMLLSVGWIAVDRPKAADDRVASTQFVKHHGQALAKQVG
jgi:hypothetical protein